MSQLAPLACRQSRKFGRENLEFQHLAAAKMFRSPADTSGFSGITVCQNAPQWTEHRSGAPFQNFARSAKRGLWKAFNSQKDATEAVVLPPTTSLSLSLSPAPEDKVETLTQRAEELLTRQLKIRRLANV